MINVMIVDIENYQTGTNEGKTISIGVRIGRGFYHFADWREWLAWVGQTPEKNWTIYAHNGGGWDWLSLFAYLLGDPDYTVEIFRANSKAVMASLKIGGKKVTLCDSLYILRSSLDTLGKSLVGRGKNHTTETPEWYWRNDRTRYLEYLKNDCELLWEVIRCADAWLKEKIDSTCRMGVTIGSTAISVWKILEDFDVSKLPITNIEADDICQRGYTGGRVEVFRSGEHRVRVYDCNSMYPFVMKKYAFPVSGRVFRVADFDPDRLGVHEIEFSQRSGLPVLCMAGNRARKGAGVFYSPEIAALVRAGGTFRHIRGYAFHDVGNPFSKFVGKLWDIRQNAKSEADNLFAKYLLNACYGKFGQRTTKEKILIGSVTDIIGKYPVFETVSAENGVFSVETENDVKHRHPGIAGLVTCYARLELYDAMISAGDDLIYSDTDSVHTRGQFDLSKVGKNLGQWKMEFDGSGVYLGKKLYALKSGCLEKIRVKGVSIGGVNGHKLLYSDMVMLLDRKTSTVCSYRSPTTLLEVLNGKPPNKFTTRKRTIRRSA